MELEQACSQKRRRVPDQKSGDVEPIDGMDFIFVRTLSQSIEIAVGGELLNKSIRD